MTAATSPAVLAAVEWYEDARRTGFPAMAHAALAAVIEVRGPVAHGGWLYHRNGAGEVIRSRHAATYKTCTLSHAYRDTGPGIRRVRLRAE